MTVKSATQPRIGVLTYDLQEFTSALLERLQAAVQPMMLTAYPCFFHRSQQDVRVAALPSAIRPRPLGVSRGGVKEAMTSSINVRAAWRLVSDNDIVILHGLQGATALLTVLLCKLRNRRAISVNHSLGPDMERRRRWWIRGLKTLLLGACDWHICQMPAAAETLAEVYGVPRERLFMAPFEGGASLYRHMTQSREERRRATRQRLGIGPHETLYLFVGNIIPLKGPELFVRAFSRLSAVPARGVLAGPEEPRYGAEGTISHYQALAASLQVSDRITMPGRLDSEGLADLYAASDVFVLPTYKDCMPKVFIEAALFGLPIITTTAPGSVGVLPDPGRNGFAVPPGDVSALATAMLELHDPVRRAEFSAASMAAVNAFCDPVKETEGFVAAIHRCIEPAR